MKQRRISPTMPLATLDERGDASPVMSGVMMIPLSRLRPCPFNIRKHRSPARIREIADSLQSFGQLEAISVYPGSDEKTGDLIYFIVSGETRHAAAALIGWSELKADCDPRLQGADALTIMAASRVHNDTLPETDLDLADSFEQLRAQNFTQEQIAKALGYGSDRRVRALKAITELPHVIRDVVKDYHQVFSASFAEQIKAARAKLDDDELAVVTRKFLSLDDPSEISKTTLAALLRAEELKKSRNTRKDNALTQGQSAQLRARLLSTDEIKINGERAGDLRVLKESDSLRRIEFGIAAPNDIADQIRDLLAEVVRKIAELNNASGRN